MCCVGNSDDRRCSGGDHRSRDRRWVRQVRRSSEIGQKRIAEKKLKQGLRFCPMGLDNFFYLCYTVLQWIIREIFYLILDKNQIIVQCSSGLKQLTCVICPWIFYFILINKRMSQDSLINCNAKNAKEWTIILRKTRNGKGKDRTVEILSGLQETHRAHRDQGKIVLLFV